MEPARPRETTAAGKYSSSPVVAGGIGAATALLAALKGFAFCVNYIHARARADEVVSATRNERGSAIAVQADVSAESEVVRLFEATGAPPGGPTALVNNAATLENQMRLDSIDRARIDRIFATNVFGSFLCAREAARRRPRNLLGEFLTDPACARTHPGPPVAPQFFSCGPPPAPPNPCPRALPQ